MSKFLKLCEEFDPSNSGSPRYDLFDYLKSKGINVSVGKGTDSITIDTGNKKLHLVLQKSEADEDAETLQNPGQALGDPLKGANQVSQNAGAIGALQQVANNPNNPQQAQQAQQALTQYNQASQSSFQTALKTVQDQTTKMKNMANSTQTI